MPAKLRAHWKCDGTYQDVVQSISGVVDGAEPVLVDGPVGGAWFLNQTQIDSSLAGKEIGALEEFTLSLWAKPTPVSSDTGYLVRVGQSSDLNYGLYQKGSSWGIGWYDSVGTSFRTAEFSSSVLIGQWQHICLIRDSNNVFTIYVNGKKAGTAEGHTTPSASRIAIGASSHGNHQPYNGFISDIRIYDDVIPDHLIQKLSNYTDNTNPRLLHHWFSSELITGRFVDETGDGFDLSAITTSPSFVEGRYPGTNAIEFQEGEILECDQTIPVPRKFSIHFWTEFPLSGGGSGWHALCRMFDGNSGYPCIVQTSTGDMGVYANGNGGFSSCGINQGDYSGWHSVGVVVHNFGDSHYGYTDFYIDGEWKGRSDRAPFDPTGLEYIGGANDVQSWGKIQDLTIWSGLLSEDHFKQMNGDRSTDAWYPFDGSLADRNGNGGSVVLSQTATNHVNSIGEGTTGATGDGTTEKQRNFINLIGGTGSAFVDFDSVELAAGTYNINTIVTGETTTINLGTTLGGSDLLSFTVSNEDERTLVLGSTTTVYSRVTISSETTQLNHFSINSQGATLVEFNGATGGYLRLRDDATGSITSTLKQEGYVSFFFRDDGSTEGPIASQLSTSTAWPEGWRIERTATGVEFVLLDSVSNIEQKDNYFTFRTPDYTTNGASNSVSISGRDIELVQGEDNAAPLVVDMDGDLDDGAYAFYRSNSTGGRIKIGTSSADTTYQDISVGDEVGIFKLSSTGPFFTFQYGENTSDLGTRSSEDAFLLKFPFHSVSVDDDVWNHCIVTWSKSKNKSRFYLNGTMVYEADFSGYTDNLSPSINIGKSEVIYTGDNINDRWQGDFDELKIGDVFLEAEQAKQFWLRPITKLPLSDTDSIHDMSSYSRNTEISGTVSNAADAPPIGNGACNFPATGSVDVELDYNMVPSKQSFSVSVWLRIPATGNPLWSLSYGSPWSNHVQSGWGISSYDATDSDPVLTALYMSDGTYPHETSRHEYCLGVDMYRESWDHYAYVIDRNSGIAKTYKNGIRTDTRTMRSDFGWISPDDFLSIGRYSSYTTGDIADFRYFMSALTDEEVSEIYSTRARLLPNGILKSHGIDTSGNDETELLRSVNDPKMVSGIEHESNFFLSAGPENQPSVVAVDSSYSQGNDVINTTEGENISLEAGSCVLGFYARNLTGREIDIGIAEQSGKATSSVLPSSEWKYYSQSDSVTSLSNPTIELSSSYSSLTNYLTNPWLIGWERGNIIGNPTINDVYIPSYSTSGGYAEILSKGMDDGLPYVTIRFAGKNTSGSTIWPSIWFEGNQDVPTPNGTTFTFSAIVESKIETDQTMIFGGHYRGSDGSYITTFGSAENANIEKQRKSITPTVSNASVFYSKPSILITVADEEEYDWTITIWGPQIVINSSFSGPIFGGEGRIGTTTGRADLSSISLREGNVASSQEIKIVNTGVIEVPSISEKPATTMRYAKGVLVAKIDEEAP